MRDDAYLLPNIIETLDALYGSKFFTILDLYSGYHQVNEPDDVEKTVFSLPGRHYEFMKMPFGLCNEPATFKRLMDNLLMGIKGEEALVYLDGIVIISKSRKQHADRLSIVLQRPSQHNLYLQLLKCLIAAKEV